ncbi:hypothetical protein FHG87_020535 [Trinorchestia longiramus]|nr:hypothetical protein FHG87_020535 [Trinorchestia longiramus]
MLSIRRKVYPALSEEREGVPHESVVPLTSPRNRDSISQSKRSVGSDKLLGRSLSLDVGPGKSYTGLHLFKIDTFHGNLVQQHRNLVQQHRNLVQQHRNLVQQHRNLVQQHCNLVQQHRDQVQQHCNKV